VGYRIELVGAHVVVVIFVFMTPGMCGSRQAKPSLSACFSVLTWLASLCFALVLCLRFIALFALPCLCSSLCLAFFCRGALSFAVPYLALPRMVPCLALGSGLVFMLRLRLGNIVFCDCWRLLLCSIITIFSPMLFP
jgi:hypothetical protein